MGRKEDRINKAPTRRRKTEPPGHEWWVLGATATCDCGWVGLAQDPDEATSMWFEHCAAAGHDPSTNHTVET